MEYTKRDLILVEKLRSNIEYIFQIPAIKGLCGVILVMNVHGILPDTELLRLGDIMEFEFKLIFPDYEDGDFVFLPNEIEPRIKFLDELIEKIKK